MTREVTVKCADDREVRRLQCFERRERGSKFSVADERCLRDAPQRLKPVLSRGFWARPFVPQGELKPCPDVFWSARTSAVTPTLAASDLPHSGDWSE